MWTRAAAVAVGTALTAGGAAAQTRPERPTLAVRIINMSEADGEVLDRAAEDAGLIFDLAGITSIWNVGHTSEDDGTHVRIALHSGMGTQVAPAALKTAKSTSGFTPCAGALIHSRIAYVFYDRIATAATLAKVPEGRVLGVTIAHEVGHMLLPRYSHSSSGIMRPSLDLQRATLPQFTASQANLIRARLMHQA